MSITVTGHRIGWSGRAILRRAEDIADQTQTEVTRAVGRMNPVEVIVTDPTGYFDIDWNDQQQLYPGASASKVVRERRSFKKKSRQTAGTTYVLPNGTVRIIINASQHRNTADLDVTLAHELVHAAQLSRPGRRESVNRHQRAQWGLEQIPRREARALDRLLDDEEREAYRLEKTLAARIR